MKSFHRGFRVPKFGNHFPLRRERTFRLRLLLRFVNLPERELRAGHQRGFAKLLIQPIRRERLSLGSPEGAACSRAGYTPWPSTKFGACSCLASYLMP